MKITPKETKIANGIHFATWTCGMYEIRVITRLNDFDYKTYEVFKRDVAGECPKNYYPKIYPDIDFNTGRLTGFTIATTAHWDLDTKEFKVYLNAMNHGYNVAKALTEYFVKEN